MTPFSVSMLISTGSILILAIYLIYIIGTSFYKYGGYIVGSAFILILAYTALYLIPVFIRLNIENEY